MQGTTKYGKFASLTINQRAPLIEGCNVPGLKTLFVRPVPNWPNAAQYPNVPGDIEITVRNQVGATTVQDVFALPAVGLSMQVQGDGLEVFAYYSPKQGLGTPYPSYNIEAGVTKGFDPETPTRHYWVADVDNSYNVLYPTTRGTIASYSKKLRIASMCHGHVSLTDPNSTATIMQYYDFAQCRDWVFFSPEMYHWQMLIACPSNILTKESVSIEFA